LKYRFVGRSIVVSCPKCGREGKLVKSGNRFVVVHSKKPYSSCVISKGRAFEECAKVHNLFKKRKNSKRSEKSKTKSAVKSILIELRCKKVSKIEYSEFLNMLRGRGVNPSVDVLVALTEMGIRVEP